MRQARSCVRLRVRLFARPLLAAVAIGLLAACAGSVVPLSVNNAPPASPSLSKKSKVDLGVRRIVVASDEMVYPRDSLFKDFDRCARVGLPLRTAMEKSLDAAIANVFNPGSSNPLESCALEVSVQSAFLTFSWFGGSTEFQIRALTKLKAPNDQILATKDFQATGRSDFDKHNVPNAVWDAMGNLSAQMVEFYGQDTAVLAFAKKPSAAPPSAASPAPESPAPSPEIIFAARRPEDAGVLPSSLRQDVSKNNRWRALLIGISDYSATGGFADSLKDIPTNDVAQLKDLLQSEYGFSEVATLTDKDATRKGILAALTKLHDACKEEDNVLIYYAGHGHLPSHGVGLWIPSDARSEEDGVSNSEIKDRIANLTARRVLLITDSCFAGSFLTRSLSVKGKEEIIKDQGQAAEVSCALARNQRVGREVITSGNLAPVPNSGQGPASKNSPFAYSLLTALKSVPTGAAISTTDLFVELYHTMSGQFEGAGERPRPQRSNLPNHAGGEFFLVRK